MIESSETAYEVEEREIIFRLDGKEYPGTFSFPPNYGEYTITADYDEELYDKIVSQIQRVQNGPAYLKEKFDCVIIDKSDLNVKDIEKKLKGCMFKTMHPIVLSYDWDEIITFDLAYNYYEEVK